MYEAKNSKIYNFWTSWPVIQLETIVQKNVCRILKRWYIRDQNGLFRFALISRMVLGVGKKPEIRLKPENFDTCTSRPQLSHSYGTITEWGQASSCFVPFWGGTDQYVPARSNNSASEWLQNQKCQLGVSDNFLLETVQVIWQSIFRGQIGAKIGRKIGQSAHLRTWSRYYLEAFLC